MDIINEMKKTRSYKKHVKLLNELIQFTSKSKKNEKLILKVADLHLVLAKSIQICSKGMKMEGGCFGFGKRRVDCEEDKGEAPPEGAGAPLTNAYLSPTPTSTLEYRPIQGMYNKIVNDIQIHVLAERERDGEDPMHLVANIKKIMFTDIRLFCQTVIQQIMNTGINPEDLEYIDLQYLVGDPNYSLSKFLDYLNNADIVSALVEADKDLAKNFTISQSTLDTKPLDFSPNKNPEFGDHIDETFEETYLHFVLILKFLSDKCEEMTDRVNIKVIKTILLCLHILKTKPKLFNDKLTKPLTALPEYNNSRLVEQILSDIRYKYIASLRE